MRSSGQSLLIALTRLSYFSMIRSLVVLLMTLIKVFHSASLPRAVLVILARWMSARDGGPAPVCGNIVRAGVARAIPMPNASWKKRLILPCVNNYNSFSP